MMIASQRFESSIVCRFQEYTIRASVCCSYLRSRAHVLEFFSRRSLAIRTRCVRLRRGVIRPDLLHLPHCSWYIQGGQPRFRLRFCLARSLPMSSPVLTEVNDALWERARRLNNPAPNKQLQSALDSWLTALQSRLNQRVTLEELEDSTLSSSLSWRCLATRTCDLVLFVICPELPGYDIQIVFDGSRCSWVARPQQNTANDIRLVINESVLDSLWSVFNESAEVAQSRDADDTLAPFDNDTYSALMRCSLMLLDGTIVDCFLALQTPLASWHSPPLILRRKPNGDGANFDEGLFHICQQLQALPDKAHFLISALQHSMLLDRVRPPCVLFERVVIEVFGYSRWTGDLDPVTLACIVFLDAWRKCWQLVHDWQQSGELRTLLAELRAINSFITDETEPVLVNKLGELAVQEHVREEQLLHVLLLDVEPMMESPITTVQSAGSDEDKALWAHARQLHASNSHLQFLFASCLDTVRLVMAGNLGALKVNGLPIRWSCSLQFLGGTHQWTSSYDCDVAVVLMPQLRDYTAAVMYDSGNCSLHFSGHSHDIRLALGDITLATIGEAFRTGVLAGLQESPELMTVPSDNVLFEDNPIMPIRCTLLLGTVTVSIFVAFQTSIGELVFPLRQCKAAGSNAAFLPFPTFQERLEDDVQLMLAVIKQAVRVILCIECPGRLFDRAVSRSFSDRGSSTSFVAVWRQCWFNIVRGLADADVPGVTKRQLEQASATFSCLTEAMLTVQLRATAYLPHRPALALSIHDMERKRGALQPDDDWHSLSEQARVYRERNQLTCTEFLRLIGLEPSPTYIQYLSSYYTNRRVSTRPGTLGATLQAAITKFLGLNIENQRKTEPPFDELLTEYCLSQDQEELAAKGVQHIEPIGSHTLLVTRVRTLASSLPATEQDIYYWLDKFSAIPGKQPPLKLLTLSRPRIRFLDIEQRLCSAGPVCMTASEYQYSEGTASVINAPSQTGGSS